MTALCLCSWLLTLVFHCCVACLVADSAIASGGRVLVHCQEGISRSSTILIAYLMARQGLSLQDAYGWVKAQRKQIFPNLGFWRQLDLFERTLAHQRLVAAAAAAATAADTPAAVPDVSDIQGTLDQCIDVALLTAEYQARKAMAEGRPIETAAAASSSSSGDSGDSSSASSSANEPREETASERVRRQVFTPVDKSHTLRAVRGVASEDARSRAEEAVVEEAQTPCGPIVTSE